MFDNDVALADAVFDGEEEIPFIDGGIGVERLRTAIEEKSAGNKILKFNKS